jgi:hypothetical protein
MLITPIPTKVKFEIECTVQEFIDIYKGINRTSYASRKSAGMKEDESLIFQEIYDRLTPIAESLGLTE